MWARFAEYLRAHGHEVTASFPRRSTLDESRQWKRLTDLGVSSRRYGVGTSNAILARTARYVLRRLKLRKSSDAEVVSILEQVQPDRVLISLPGALSLGEWLTLASSCFRSGIPYAIINHGLVPHRFPHNEWYEAELEAYTRARGVVAVSRHMRKELERRLALQMENVEVIYNSVDLEYLRVQPWPRSEVTTMSCVGRLEPEHKGQHLLFEALSDNAWKQRDWELRVYGDGPCSRVLNALSAYFGLVDHVRFMGFEDDIRKVWSSSHLLVLPSIFEGMPLALLEAWASGRPALCVGSGGPADLVEDGINGWLHRPGDVADISDKLSEAWDQQHRWEEMGQRGRETVERHGNLARNCSKLYELLVGS